MRVVLLTILISLTGPALAEVCPLDRTIFKEAESGREFVAQRVAVDYRYVCDWNNPSNNHYSRPQAKLEKKCAGPFGETIIEGLLNGETAYAVYSVEKAWPCCLWHSYAGNDKEVAGKVKEWLQPAEVPVITLNDEWYTIGPKEWFAPLPPDQGWMGGGRFVPTNCRSG